MRVLLSVYDKTGLVDLARALAGDGHELIASGGTAAALAGAGVDHVTVESVTQAPEMLGGRVKTLHPKVHGGILADRSKPEHLADLEDQGIAPIDLVVCNLYPFRSNPSIELIDVGGPTMVRAAAKNWAHVGVVVDPADYDAVLAELRADGALSEGLRRRLARAAFAHTAAYDAAITTWFDESAPTGDASDEALPDTVHLALERAQALRYGENPHQRGARYREVGTRSWWDDVVQHGGMALSYLNLYDADAAWRMVHQLADLGEAAAVVVKHANPCGAAVAGDLGTAYEQAFECDPMSAFGGIVALSAPVDLALAEELVANPKADVLIAPSFADEALESFAAKRKNMRVLSAPAPTPDRWHLRQISGGWLVQDPYRLATGRGDWRVVTKASPTEGQWRDLELAWRVCAWVKSNAIVLAARGTAVGIGGGQQNRVTPGEIAVARAAGRAQGGAAASDAFFPFRDGLDAVAAAGVSAVIQPGGSMGDEKVIAAADEHGLAMVFTGERQFQHWSATLLPGAPVAEAVLADVTARVARLEAAGRGVGLGTILVGDDPASAGYVAKKHRTCEQVGMASYDVRIPADATQADLLAAVGAFNADPAVDAFIVQNPVPAGFDFNAAMLAVDPGKDADGLHPTNLGLLALGDPSAPRPCTPLGIQALLVHHQIPVAGRRVVVVGRGPTLGRPLSMLLTLKEPGANAAVTVVHTGVPDWRAITREADIVVGAAGVPSMIMPADIRPGSVVVSGGISWEGRRLLPDVDESCGEVAGWITPRLGGVGVTTVAMLLQNTVAAAERRQAAAGPPA